uniref:Chymotrypsin-like serine protease 15 n=1 Tax=Ostrinia nubilalis TaxID=29057 RepID=I6TEX4_OSTNU|nr:chymotrypsin-like serine protease 15 [Ostrinia nubilalis]
MVFLKCIILFGLLGHIANGSPLKSEIMDLNPHIVGGVDAPDGYAPHSMALTSGYWVNSLMCGASIISECHVLTAAHCIEALLDINGQLLSTLHGVYATNEWQSTKHRTKFSGFINHEKYDAFLYKYDIGVLFLDGKLTPSDKWAIIALNFDWIDAGDKSSVTGYGRLWNWGPIATRLQLLYLKTIGEKECADGVSAAMPPGWWIPPVDQRVEICTFKGEGFGLCNGDSDSALVSLKTNTQTGIVAWGFPCARGAPDMFVRVSAFKDFLLNIMKTCDKC